MRDYSNRLCRFFSDRGICHGNLLKVVGALICTQPNSISSFQWSFFALLSLSSREQADKTNEALERELSNTSDTEAQIALDSLETDTLTLDSMINVQPMSGSKTLSKELSFTDFDEELVDSLHESGASFEEILNELDIQQASFFKKYITSQALRLYLKKGAGFLSVFYSAITFVLFISIPIFALFLKLLYYKGRPYTHHLVFAFDFFAVLFIGFISHIVIVKTITLPDSWLGVLYLLIVLHLFLSLKFFYRQKWLTTILKSVVLVLMFSIFLIPLSLILTGAFAFLVY